VNIGCEAHSRVDATLCRNRSYVIGNVFALTFRVTANTGFLSFDSFRVTANTGILFVSGF